MGVIRINVSVRVGVDMITVRAPVGDASAGTSDNVGVGEGLFSGVGVALDDASVGRISGVLDDAVKLSKGVEGVSSPWGFGRSTEDSVGALVRFALEMPICVSCPLEFAIGTAGAALATSPICLHSSQIIGKIIETNMSRTVINCQSEVFDEVERLLV